MKVKLVAVVKLRYSGKKGSTAAANEILEAIPNGNVPFSYLDKLRASRQARRMRVGLSDARILFYVIYLLFVL